MNLAVRPLLPSDDRSSFRSGNPDLDRFFARFAGQNQFRHHLGVTYVAVEDERLLGYVTVAPSEVSGDALPTRLRKRLPAYPLPVLSLWWPPRFKQKVTKDLRPCAVVCVAHPGWCRGCPSSAFAPRQSPTA